VDVLHWKTPLIFGAGVKLHPLFDVFQVLHFKIPLIFGAFVELRLQLLMPVCCIAKDLLYLALVLKYVSHLAFLMCCIAKNSYIWRLFLTSSFIWKFRGDLMQNTFNIWRLC